jgi:hypothetical protein
MTDKQKIKEVEKALDGKVTFYDPPSGWRYGFPKQYKPLPGETLEGTLLRDGYPEQDLALAANHTRFWESAEGEY